MIKDTTERILRRHERVPACETHGATIYYIAICSLVVFAFVSLAVFFFSVFMNQVEPGPAHVQLIHCSTHRVPVVFLAVHQSSSS